MIHDESGESSGFDVSEDTLSELEIVKQENESLRKIVSDSASVLPNGAYIHPKASVGFMAGLPKEVLLVTSEQILRISTLEQKLKGAEAALERLATPEAFTVPRLATKEETARMFFAADALATLREIAK